MGSKFKHISETYKTNKKKLAKYRLQSNVTYFLPLEKIKYCQTQTRERMGRKLKRQTFISDLKASTWNSELQVGLLQVPLPGKRKLM